MHQWVERRGSAGMVLAASALLYGCGAAVYDNSTPQAALDSMRQMIVDGRPEQIGTMIHIEPRDISFSDGVTEASAIEDVKQKTGDMLGQLYRVALKLRERFPDQIGQELSDAKDSAQQNDWSWLERFLTDPFGLIDEQRQRLSVEDLGDGTAAILIDGKPAFGFGLQMREIDGAWRIDVPIDLLQKYRPNTREEWSVLASMMLSLENALTAFEDELDAGQFQDLSAASRRAGRLLGERAVIQGLIYQGMKDDET